MHKPISLPTALAAAMAYQQQRPAIVTAGTQALNRLIPVALEQSGQSRVVGRFLLGLYNGEDYPFDLTELRTLDLPLFEDCVKVLLMDYSPEVEVHERVPNGGRVWDRLCLMWSSREELPEQVASAIAADLADEHRCWEHATASASADFDHICSRCGAPLRSERWYRLQE